MISYISHVMTLANSIIGVSVLAMPFCFKQCGIILSVLVLTLCSLLSRIACHFLIKSAVMSRRRNYEFLAFHAFGHMGKILVELLIIGFLIGTCIAFFVVVGDLGPQIIGKLLNKTPGDIKLSFLLTTASLIVLPLGLLRNIGSLASICTVAIGFYLCLVLKVIMESMGHIFSEDWYEHVNYWRPAGILQCLPIFSMALFCQTQLFEIYDSIPNVSLEKMNVVVKGAINICTLVYISVGFFGYVGFCTQSFSGNILMSFEPSLSSDAIKIGFVLSVIASFPLVIFPCRASLNSLLFRRVYLHESTTNYIPEIRFRCLTFTIITVSLITGLLMPNIEFVLGLVGSTIGVLICLIFPAAFFIAISTKNTNERLIAQAMLFVGMWIMILGTYANIYSVEESSSTRIVIPTDKPILQINNIQQNSNIDAGRIIPEALARPIRDGEELPSPRLNLPKSVDLGKQINPAKVGNQIAEIINNLNSTLNRPKIEDVVLQPKKLYEEAKNGIYTSAEVGPKQAKDPLTAEGKISAIEEKMRNVEQPPNDNVIHSDAIKKEDSEIAAAADQSADAEAVERLKNKQQIQDTLAQHKIETIKLMEEQKAILQDIKEQKKEFEMEKKLLENRKSNIGNVDVVHPNLQATNEKENEIAKNADAEDPKKLTDVQQEDNKIPEKLLVKQNVIPQNVKEPTVDLGTDERIVDNPKINHDIEGPTDLLKMESTNNNKKELVTPLLDSEKHMKNETLRVFQAVDHESIIPDSKGDDDVKKVNVSVESRGPILSILTNKTQMQRVESNSPTNAENSNRNDKRNDSDKMQYAIPIALKLINQTKDDGAHEIDDVMMKKSSVIHRDILEDRVREKRDIDEITIMGADNPRDTNVMKINDENGECAKNKTNVSKDSLDDSKKAVQAETTTGISIKTYASLSDEQFIDNIGKFDPSSVSKLDEYQVLKKRDLKSLKPGKSRK